MRELPPDSLMSRMIALRLCTAADVQRAGRLVRRLTRDLPAFDSIWIDGLTQLGVLTPFQGRWLESEPPESLVIGDFVLLEGFEAGTASRTFLAAGRDRRRVVLKRLQPPADQMAAVELRLDQLREQARAIQSRQLTTPLAVVRDGASLFVASRHVPGRNVSELLVRRGRFPARVVLAVADQLFAALSALHAAGLAHGDLRLTKIRLTDQGQVVLVDSGFRSALSPELLVHRVESPEEADGVAPERIGSNGPATAATDLYAAGCALWQLLTGRPPYSPADPLAKLAAHQTSRIADVRDLAPDTPGPLAELIHQLTSPNPLDRPTSAAAARSRLGLRGRPRTGELARFLRQFDVTVPHLKTRSVSGTRSWKGVTAAVFLLGIAVVALSDRGLRTELLNIAERVRNRQAAEPGDADEATSERRDSENQFAKIPAADPQGVITLTEAGPYQVRKISTVGSLTIQAAPGIRPQIIVQDAPLVLVAPEIVLKEIDVIGTTPASDVEDLVQLRCQQLQMAGCRFSGPERAGVVSTELAAMSWEPQDRRDQQAGFLQMESTCITGALHGLVCREAPRCVTCRQVLKAGAGTAVVVDRALAQRGLQLICDHVTLRETGSLLSCSGSLTEQYSASLIEIETTESVFQPLANAPLIECCGPKMRPDWRNTIRIAGEGTLLSAEAIILGTLDPDEGATSVLESDELVYCEGLSIDAFEFAGQMSTDPRDSQLAKTRAPRRSQSLPGADPDHLP